MLGRRVRACRRERDRSSDRDDVHDVGSARRLERRQESPQTPDRPEVVDAQHFLQSLEIDRREAGTTGNSRIVHEQLQLRMPLSHSCCDTLNVVAAADVAQLVLAVELLRERAQPVLAARDQHRVPAGCGQRARDRRPDPAGGARDDGNALVLYRQTLTSRVAERFRPAASVASALKECRPAGTRLVPQEPV
jgi:hypothetical protein